MKTWWFVVKFRIEEQSSMGLTKLMLFEYTVYMVGNIPFLDQIISIIVNEASPDQIILFGSYARGDNTEKSDIDLLIRKKNLQKGNKTIDILYRAFFDNHIKIPVDLLIIDYDRYNVLKNEIGYVYKTINKEGQVVYGTA
jgi:predicted nucleotidyltransferase